MSLVLPPLEDMVEISSLQQGNYSISDHAAATTDFLVGQFRDDLYTLQRKHQKFASVATYHNRIANLATIVGDVHRADAAISDALRISRSTFFLGRLAENRLAAGDDDGAERLFSSPDFASDIHANLRLAFFHLRRNELAAASSRVDSAVEIDPFDFGARMFQGGLALLKGALEESIRCFRVASEARPNSSALHGNMGIAYIKLGQIGKAFGSLKRAVALNPLNENAVLLLSDLAFKEKRDEDAIPTLRYFVEFEQRSVGIWARLARAALQIGNADECIAALKRQGSLQDNSAVWNNLGVAYQAKGMGTRGLQAFKHALSFSRGNVDHDYLLAARNVAQYLTSHADSGETLKFVKSVLEADSDNQCLKDNDLSDLHAFHLRALRNSGRPEEAAALCWRLLESGVASDKLSVWLISGLIAYESLYLNKLSEYTKLLTQYSEQIASWTTRNEVSKNVLFNNVAFAFAEYGQVGEAEENLQKISSAIHKEPFPTATLGLIQMRKGRIEKATELYEEASQLAISRADRTTIRQKLNLELGKYWASRDARKSQQLLMRVIDLDDGERALEREAKELLRRLEHRKA
jgi:tetratricopeptide (TPR) repeat protein